MGKVTLLMFFCAFSVFVASALGILNPSSSLTGLLLGGFMGIGLFITGPIWFGMKMYKSISVQKNLERENFGTEIFTIENAHKVVDYIDSRANESVMATNNEWIKRNWHVMSDSEKIDWVKIRLEYLKETLVSANEGATPAFINAIQTADKNYQRKLNQSA